MALEGSFVDRFGVQHEHAYAKITYLSINMLDLTGDLIVNIWHNKTARDSRREPVETKHYVINTKTFNTLLGQVTGVSTLFIPIYHWLKTQDFGDWNDV